MHRHPTLMIELCLERAKQCRRGAERAIEPARRRSWLELEGRWFFLARSYDNERRTAMPVPAILAKRVAAPQRRARAEKYRTGRVRSK